MATQPTIGLTYDDLAAMPEDHLRRELLDGELFVTASPVPRHQRIVVRLVRALDDYAREHGGEVLPAPLDVYLSHTNVVAPDLLFVLKEHLGRFDERKFVGPPDVVIEISSPSTRRIDLGKKRDIYERFAVPEYWFVDLRREVVEVRRLVEERFGVPRVLVPGEVLSSPNLPGFELAIADLLDA